MITKKTIMRTQSQAGLSFAERKNFRPQVKNKLLLLLALLMTAATGAWADVTWSLSGGTLTISGTGAMEDYTKASNNPWYTNKTNITSIVVEEGVTHIGNYAFQVYTNVTSISLPTSLTSIGTSAFQGCSNAALTSITIPENVTTIGQGAFQACSSLTTVTIPDKVTTIGNSAFSSCSGLTSVNIPNSVETIGQMAFRACTGLTSVTIGNSVTSIGNNVFNACSNLATVTVKAPSCTLGTTAFDGCTSLTAIYVPSGKVDTYKGAENWSNYATYIQGDPNAEPAGPTSFTVTMKDGVKDADKWTIEPTEAKPGTEIKATYSGNRHVKGVKAVKKAAAAEGKTYTNLQGGEVLHVGDKFTETEGKYRFTHDENPKLSDYYTYIRSSITYEVLRADVVKDGYYYKYTESPNGQYYVLKCTYFDYDDLEEWVTEYDFHQDLPVTGTSDGITVTLDGQDGDQRNLYTFWVHEPNQ